MLTQNGNRWIGAGHNAIVTDLAGQDFIAYHAIDRADPYLDGTDGINQRPMLLDRLDWVGGWPTVRAGQGPSDGPERAPVTSGRFTTTFSGGRPRDAELRGSWAVATDAQSGSYARSAGAGSVVTRSSTPGDVRTEADLRSSGAAYGLVLSQHGPASTRLRVIDPRAGTATLRQEEDGAPVRSTTAALPAGFDPADWHAASLERRGDTVTAQLSHARLGDPVVDLRITLRRGSARTGVAGAVAGGAGVGVDNLSALPAAVPVTRLAPEAVPSRLDRAASDEFTGAGVDPAWQWVRRDDRATVSGGSLRWPTEDADLTGASNNAGLLLRDPGAGAWTGRDQGDASTSARTRCATSSRPGWSPTWTTTCSRGSSHVAIWNTRQTEFGKEMPYAGRLSYGGHHRRPARPPRPGCG